MKIFEVSSAINLVKQLPGGKEVVQYLHTNYQLAHNQEFAEVPKERMSWQQIKDWARGAWVIMSSDTGALGIRLSSRGTYNVIVWSQSTKEIQQYQYSNLTDVNSVVKEYIGRPRHYFVSRATDDVERLRTKRERPASEDLTVEKLVLRFRPIWVRAIEQARADIKGIVANMLKNDAYDKIENKIHRLGSLVNVQRQIEDGNPLPDNLKNAAEMALIMTASYFYPEDTGNIGTERWRSQLRPEKMDGAKKVLADIQAGDMEKFSALLSFFKKSLIA